MLTIPSQQVIYTMNGCQRDMQCILRRFWGNNILIEQAFSDGSRLFAQLVILRFLHFLPQPPILHKDYLILPAFTPAQVYASIGT